MQNSVSFDKHSFLEILREFKLKYNTVVCGDYIVDSSPTKSLVLHRESNYHTTTQLHLLSIWKISEIVSLSM